MKESECKHIWKMVNITPCFIGNEKCYHCDKVATFRTSEYNPPFEEYREGDHFWNTMETDQSIKFDLQCSQCGMLVDYDELLGLKMCTGCHEECEVNKLLKKLEPKRTYIYVAFGFLPMSEHKQLSPEKIGFLEDYFNQRRRSSKSKIKIVSYKMVDNIHTCYAAVIKDKYMLSLTPPPEK